MMRFKGKDKEDREVKKNLRPLKARKPEVSVRKVSHREQGWRVISLWGHDILRKPNKCRTVIKKAMKRAREKQMAQLNTKAGE